MTCLFRTFPAIFFGCLISIQAAAEVPVFDDSENFAILDEQQTTYERPVGKSNAEYVDTEEELALAQDNESRASSDASLLNQFKGLQQDIQELRGLLEMQAHELKLLQQQQLSFYKDLDARLQNPSQAALKGKKGDSALSEHPLTSASTAAEPIVAASAKHDFMTGNPSPVNGRLNPADEQISYLAAYDLVKNKHFDEALIAMQQFVIKYPKGGYTANAQYWLGELYMVKKDYPNAIEHFETVLKYFSNSSKAAPCSLKIGYALAASGKKQEAKMRLQQVIQNFPDTPTAQLAATKLNTLNS